MRTTKIIFCTIVSTPHTVPIKSCMMYKEGMAASSRARLWTDSPEGGNALTDLLVDELIAISYQSGIEYKHTSGLVQQFDLSSYVRMKLPTLKKSISALESEQEIDLEVEREVCKWAHEVWPSIIHQRRRMQFSGEIPIKLNTIPEGDAKNAERGMSTLPHTGTESQKHLYNAIVADTFSELRNLV